MDKPTRDEVMQWLGTVAEGEFHDGQDWWVRYALAARDIIIKREQAIREIASHRREPSEPNAFRMQEIARKGLEGEVEA